MSVKAVAVLHQNSGFRWCSIGLNTVSRWLFFCFTGKNCLQCGLVDKCSHPASNQVETGEKEFLTIRPVAQKGYGSIAHEAKRNGLLTHSP